MADESNQKPDSENGDEQGEVRNDVVVKIGLVGDAQVSTTPSVLDESFFSDYIDLLWHCRSVKQHSW